MKQLKYLVFTLFLSCIFSIPSIMPTPVSAASILPFEFVILSEYKTTVDIKDEFYLVALTSTGKKASWKSSDSKIASVNTYGKVTAKKAGVVKITAKIKDAEASCIVYVNPTNITLNKTNAALQRGDQVQLSATTSNGSKVTWKTNKKSVATVDANGLVTGFKPGEAIITATADGSSVITTITVNSPTVTLNRERATIYRNKTCQLTATISSSAKPIWKTNKKSVAVVDENGMVTAIKNGTAIISVTVDGVVKRCEVIVAKPEIELSDVELTLEKGKTKKLTAEVSSGNKATWTTSNQDVARISSDGTITAVSKGRAYVYASEDGTKIRCTVYVTE